MDDATNGLMQFTIVLRNGAALIFSVPVALTDALYEQLVRPEPQDVRQFVEVRGAWINSSPSIRQANFAIHAGYVVSVQVTPHPELAQIVFPRQHGNQIFPL